MITNTDDIAKLLKELALPVALTEMIRQDIHNHYYLGIEGIEKLVNRNIVDVNPEVLQVLENNTFELIKDLNVETGNKLRQIIRQNILAKQSSTRIIKEIKNLFDTTELRARMIARTETARAYNTGAFEAAKKSDITKRKYYSTINDSRTCELCNRLGRKYDKEHSIPKNQYFIDDITGKSFQVPPGERDMHGTHPSCRCEAIFTI